MTALGDERSMDFPPALTEAQRQRLAEFADRLIAGGEGLPSASEVEVHGKWMDRVFAAQPELADVVRQVIGRAGAPAEVLRALRASERETFDRFAYAVAGAYLIHPRVRKLLGYPSPAPHRAPAFPDEAEAYLEDGILNPVIERGPIYRPVEVDAEGGHTSSARPTAYS